MLLEELKKIIPNSEKWSDSHEITFGWSGEQKYIIKDGENNKFLLRILTKHQYEEQVEGIKFLEKCSMVCEYVPKIIDKGCTKDNSYYYLLLQYIEGEEGIGVIKQYSLKEQYDLGFKMGKIIKQLHSISEPIISNDLSNKFKEKFQTFLDNYFENEHNYTFLKRNQEIIKNLKNLDFDSPMIMLHNDFHLGNMVINGNEIYLIDFNRASMGDRVKEFDGIAWSVRSSEQFAIGLMDSYLEGEDKYEFFSRLRIYIAIWQIQMLYFIKDQDEEEKKTVIDLIKFVDSWFTEGNVPNWYKMKN